MTAADWTTIGQPQDIRLVVADMDGTLLDERSRIPDGFWPMLARLKRRGVEFVPASGRQYATLRNMFADNGAEILDGGELSYIAENGNVVALDGKVVEVHGVDLDVTRHVIDLVDDAAASGEHNVGLVVCGLKSAYVQRSDKPFLDEVGKYYAALSIETDDGSFAAGRSQDTGLTMRISNMTLAEKGLPATRQQITENLFAALQRLDYVPATVTMPGDPAFEPGDRVALPMEDGTAPEMLVTHFVWRYRGRQTLKGVGRNPYLGGTTDGATEKALRRLQNSAESKGIVYYSFTNPAELAVQTVETPAVAIAFTAVEETSAMFLAQLLLDAAPDTGKVLTLTVRYYINDVLVENFAPQQRLETGAHTLALFYPFASVEAGTVTRLSVRLVCAGGTVKIAPYGIKATVTGQGMASEMPWDGTLECEETLLPIAIKARSINV